MVFNLAPWFYRDWLKPDSGLKLECYKVELIDGQSLYESNATFASRPDWVSASKIYNNCDGTGTDKYKNVSVYKAISEALERLAFYDSFDSGYYEYLFDINPTTTGMAAFPHVLKKYSRQNARNEAVERWAIHEFNRHNLQVLYHRTIVNGLSVYELVVPFSDVKVCLLSLNKDNIHTYGFAGGSNFGSAYNRALVELNRNFTVLKKIKNHNFNDFLDSIDRTLVFFSTSEGYLNFLEKIRMSPARFTKPLPKVICDKEMIGEWSKYSVVWRYLLEDSYFDCSQDHTFFMF